MPDLNTVLQHLTLPPLPDDLKARPKTEKPIPAYDERPDFLPLIPPSYMDTKPKRSMEDNRLYLDDAHVSLPSLPHKGHRNGGAHEV